MVKCIFIEECNGKSKYGKYCYKHRENYLKINDKINIFNFTNKSSDYLKKDMIKYHDQYFDKVKGENKEYYFEILKKLKESLDIFRYSEKEIVKIQCLIRGNQVLSYLRKDCKNDEDFYTYDSLREVPDKYYYSYRDTNRYKWGFDLRSIFKLIQTSKKNPYTMEEIPSLIIKDIKAIVQDLKNKNEYYEIINEVSNNRIDHIKHKCVDLFIRIECIGHSCSVEWYMDLTREKLIKLYRNLEDIWNYRAALDIYTKQSMIPPHGRLFKMTNETLNTLSRYDLLSMILNEVIKFESGSDFKLGYLFFIIALGTVNRECYHTHQWLSFI